MDAPLSVIVVDDQAPFRLAARAVLRRTEGFELVGEAANGLEAISLADSLNPDLVLMDINMPEMGGLEATRRSWPATPAPWCSCARPTTSTISARGRQNERRPGVHAQGAVRTVDTCAGSGKNATTNGFVS